MLGGGMSGLCMGIRLKQSGIQDFVVLEKAEQVGGTWRENTYPGIACDVPSHLYSFSFDLNPDWSHVYSGGEEIQAYCEACVPKYGLESHLRLGTEVSELRFDAGVWKVRTRAAETFTADLVVSALGGLHVPNMPEFAGQDNFNGRLFHSAEWDHDCDLSGKRVAVIGTGASAVQIVPEVAKIAKSLTVFQRTPGWVVPRNDRAYTSGEKDRLHKFPLYKYLVRLWIYLQLEVRVAGLTKHSLFGKLMKQAGLKFIASQVSDPDLKRKVTPSFEMGCKRILVSDDYYKTLSEPHVSVETSPVKRMVANGVETDDGETHEFDVIIPATGFKPFDITAYVDIYGKGGVSLHDAWQERIEAYRTMMVPQFPNFFMLLGPNSGLGHNSVILMIEAQVGYVLKCLALMNSRGAQTMEPTPAATREFNDGLQRGLRRMVFGSGCGAWYTDDQDRNFTLWPWSTPRYFWSLRKPVETEFDLAQKA